MTIPDFSFVNEEVINRLKDDKVESEVKRVRKQIEKYFRDKEIIDRMAIESDVEFQENIVYLKKYINRDQIDHLIAYQINQHPDRYKDVLHYKEKTILYTVETCFPEYIPDFESIRSQIKVMEDSLAYNEIDFDFNSYFEDNRELFQSADSVKIAGAFFTINTDSVKVELKDIKDYYDENPSRFTQIPSIRIEYLFFGNTDEINPYYLKELQGKITSTTSISELNEILGFDIGLPQAIEISLKDLDPSLLGIVEMLQPGEFSDFVQIDSGWVLLKLLSRIEGGTQKYSAVRDEIAETLKRQLADEFAYLKAKTVFDSSRYFSNSKAYADSSELFVSKLQSIDDSFPVIGELGELKRHFKLLWGGDKLSQIYRNKAGYGVLFKLQGVPSRKLTFEEALPIMRKTVAEDNKNEVSKRLLDKLIKEFSITENADSLMFFFGGIKHSYEVTVSGSLFDIENSDLIIRDALSRREGYCSRPIRINDNQFMFYKINSINRISADQIKGKLSLYRRESEADDYDKWFKNYSSEIEIKKY